MFDWLKRTKPSPARGRGLREVLFGDLPPAEWAAGGTGVLSSPAKKTTKSGTITQRLCSAASSAAGVGA